MKNFLDEIYYISTLVYEQGSTRIFLVLWMVLWLLTWTVLACVLFISNFFTYELTKRVSYLLEYHFTGLFGALIFIPFILTTYYLWKIDRLGIVERFDSKYSEQDKKEFKRLFYFGVVAYAFLWLLPLMIIRISTNDFQ